jgi:hypothetical protein
VIELVGCMGGLLAGARFGEVTNEIKCEPRDLKS